MGNSFKAGPLAPPTRGQVFHEFTVGWKTGPRHAAIRELVLQHMRELQVKLALMDDGTSVHAGTFIDRKPLPPKDPPT